MFVSDGVLPYITACGYDLFNENVYSDHRLIFLDIDWSIFTNDNVNQHTH